MNATSLYVSTCRYILHADHENPDSWGDLYRLLPYLRQSLSCCVCGNLLSDPMGPTNSTCQHHVCKGCLGGKMLLKPSCSWCKDYSLFAENKQLQILLSCYKKLCEYIADTPIARNMVGANGGTSNTLAILQEGMAINEGNAYAQSKKNSDERAVHVNIMELLTKANKNVPMPNDSGGPPGPGPGLSPPRASSSTPNANQNNTAVPTVVTNGGTPSPNRKSISGSVQGSSPTTSSPSTTSPSPRAGSSNHSGDLHDTGMDSEGGMTSSASYSVSLSSSGEMPRIKIKRKHKSNREGEKHKKKKKDKKHKRHRHKHNHSGNSDSPTPPKVKKLIISGHRAKLLKAGRKLHIRAGCRCGTGGPKPGMFTCLGARCPCYVSEMGCTKCRCKGCRNPYTKPRTAIPAHVMKLDKKEDIDEDVDIDVTE